jgi:hypothetical protein
MIIIIKMLHLLHHCLALGGSSLKLLVGHNAGIQSPATLESMPRFILGRVEVLSGATVSVPLDEDLDVGFAFVLQGGGPGTVIGGHEQETGG